MSESRIPRLARIDVALARSLEWVWPSGAAWAYGDAIRWAPEEPELHCRQGEALALARRWPAAARAFSRAARLSPRHLEYQASLVVALHHAARRDELVTGLRRLIELRPDEGELSVLLGAVLLRQGRRVEALRAFRWAARLSPGHQRRRFVLGETLLGAEGWDQALASWQGAARIEARETDGAGSESGRSILHRHPGRRRARVSARKEGPAPLSGLLARLRGRWGGLGGVRQSIVRKVAGDESERRVRALRRAWHKANPHRSRFSSSLLSLRRRAPDASA
jgi:tetratricopeptide (TPR) repeat protein